MTSNAIIARDYYHYFIRRKIGSRRRICIRGTKKATPTIATTKTPLSSLDGRFLSSSSSYGCTTFFVNNNNNISSQKQQHQQQHNNLHHYLPSNRKFFFHDYDSSITKNHNHRHGSIRFVSSSSSSSSISSPHDVDYDVDDPEKLKYKMMIQQQQQQMNDDDNDDDENILQQQQQQPWKNLLETSARASWRVTDPPSPGSSSSYYDDNENDDNNNNNAESISSTNNNNNISDESESSFLSILLQNCQQILQNGNRTPKQLARAYNRKILDIHQELEEYRERERRRIVQGGRITSRKSTSSGDDDDDNDVDPQQSQSSTSTRTFIMDNINNNSSSGPNIVYYGYEETLANLRYRIKPNYAITKRVLEETKCLLSGGGANNNNNNCWKPKRIIDFGIGCGSSSVAALDVFDGCNIEWIHGIEPSQPMKDCSKKLIEGIHNMTTKNNKQQQQQPFRLTFSNTLSTSTTTESSSSSLSPASGGTFDLAIMTYTATELPDVYATLAAAAILFDKLKPNGVFVMIEPGTPDGFNSCRSVRSMLLDCCPPVTDSDDDEDSIMEQCHIIAPCTHNGNCPMERHKRKYKPKKGKLGHDLPQQTNTASGSSDGNDDDDLDDRDLEYDDDDDDDTTTNKRKNLMKETDAFNSSFCSFVHSLASSDSNHNTKGEKFSYLVAQKRIAVGDDDDDEKIQRDDYQRSNSPVLSKYGNVTELLKLAHLSAANEDSELATMVYNEAQNLESKYMNTLLSDDDDDDGDGDDTLGLNLLHGDEQRQSMGRIVRAPIKKKGHVYVDYCTGRSSSSSTGGGDGKIIRSRITKANSNNIAPGMYTAARKSRWGGFWPDLYSGGSNNNED